LRADLGARRGLPAFVFGDVEQVFDAFDSAGVMAAGDDVLRPVFLALDQAA
jgi:hypothetical protein